MCFCMKCSLGKIKRYPPFYDKKPIGIYDKILRGVIEFPAFLSSEAKDLIRKLLNSHVQFRLGNDDVK